MIDWLASQMQQRRFPAAPADLRREASWSAPFLQWLFLDTCSAGDRCVLAHSTRFRESDVHIQYSKSVGRCARAHERQIGFGTGGALFEQRWMDDAGVPAFTGLSELRACFFVPWSWWLEGWRDACVVAGKPGIRAGYRLVGLGRGVSGTAHAELCMMAGRIELANRLLRGARRKASLFWRSM